MRVHAITLGCQMSAADGAQTLSALRRRGWERAGTEEEADAIVMTTCSVRSHAEQRAMSLIGALRAWKAADPRRVLVVTGCMAERLGPRLTQRFSHIDLLVGARSAADCPEIVADELCKRFPAPPQAAPEPDCPPRGQSVPSGGHPCAFLTIMRGCACACAYCIVPSVRGPEVCRPPEDILAEARALAAGGVRELTLLGQRVNAYVWEKDGRRTDFADLLGLLDEVPGLERLRFMSPHPALCDDRLARAIRDCRKACEWLHLPAQSGCDRLLGLMRRGTTSAQLLDTAARLRRTIPGVVLSTDIIVGFPSETESEFEQTLAWLEEFRPATAFCFKYSARAGTPAASLPDDVAPRVKQERLARLNALVDRLTQEALRSQIGGVVEVLAETPDFGRTRTGFKVRWQRPAAPGDLVPVRIGSATRRTLLGEIYDP